MIESPLGKVCLGVIWGEYKGGEWNSDCVSLQLVCTNPRFTSLCGEPGLWDRAELLVQAEFGMGTFPGTAPALVRGLRFCCPQLRLLSHTPPCLPPGVRLSTALLSSLPCVQRKAHPSSRSSRRGERAPQPSPASAAPLGPGAQPGAPPRCLIPGEARPLPALFEFPAEPSPVTAVCQGCKSFTAGMVPPSLSTGRAGGQRGPRQAAASATSHSVSPPGELGDPTAAPFCVL